MTKVPQSFGDILVQKGRTAASRNVSTHPSTVDIGEKLVAARRYTFDQQLMDFLAREPITLNPENWYLPFPKMWIEWPVESWKQQEVGDLRALYLCESAIKNRIEGICFERHEDGRIAFNEYFVDMSPEDGTMSCTAVSPIDVDEHSKDHFSGTVAIHLEVLNRRETFEHADTPVSKLRQRMIGTRTGRLPMTVIKMKFSPEKTAKICKRTLSTHGRAGTVAQYGCKKHPRTLASGNTIMVSAHLRGDPKNGVRPSAYQVGLSLKKE